jgi:hypothetical protein
MLASSLLIVQQKSPLRNQTIMPLYTSDVNLPIKMLRANDRSPTDNIVLFFICMANPLLVKLKLLIGFFILYGYLPHVLFCAITFCAKSTASSLVRP